MDIYSEAACEENFFGDVGNVRIYGITKGDDDRGVCAVTSLPECGLPVPRPDPVPSRPGPVPTCEGRKGAQGKGQESGASGRKLAWVRTEKVDLFTEGVTRRCGVGGGGKERERGGSYRLKVVLRLGIEVKGSRVGKRHPPKSEVVGCLCKNSCGDPWRHDNSGFPRRDKKGRGSRSDRTGPRRRTGGGWG